MSDVDAVLGSLTPAERASLTCGADLWTVAGVPGKVPAIRVTDGPNGARGSGPLGTGRATALCVPCGSALGATWDPALVRRVGEVLGAEARTKGARVLLAPTVNLPRHPLFGRSFECFSEDPVLTSALAIAYVEGVQSQGVAAVAKHFVANETEHRRLTSNSEVGGRVLRELYLVPFEQLVRAGVAAVMTSYNRVNGAWVTESPELMGWLRDEQGFDGVVMTDWYAVGSPESLELGIDLQMPGPARFFGASLAGRPAADDAARRWLQLVDRLGAWDDADEPERSEDDPGRRAVAREAVAAGTVLLRNDGVLPLAPGTRVALVGPHGLSAQVMGGGSAQLRPHRVRTLVDELAARGVALVVEQGCLGGEEVLPLAVPLETEFRDARGTAVATTTERDGRLLWFDSPPTAGVDEAEFSFTAKGFFTAATGGRHLLTLDQAGRARLLVDGVVVLDGATEPPPPGGPRLFGLGSQRLSAEVRLEEGQRVEVVVEYDSAGSFLLRGVEVGLRPPAEDLLARAVAAAQHADVAVVVVGTGPAWESEGRDRPHLGLPGEQEAMVRAVVAAAPRVVVVVAAGAPVDLRCADGAAAVLLPWLAGEEAAAGIADVLLGDAEPGGRLPVSWPLRVEHVPAHGSFPGEADRVPYAEGLLTGYRWYDDRHLPLAFPFGHGSSYTTFAWGAPVLHDRTVEVAVTNVGDRPGCEVVQVYVEPPPGPLLRPRRELRGFAKLALAPGETGVARIALDDRALAAWDPGHPEAEGLAARTAEAAVVPQSEGPAPRQPGWWVDPGSYLVHVGASIADLRGSVTITVPAAYRV